MAATGTTRRDMILGFARIAGASGAFAAMQALGLVANAGSYTGPRRAILARARKWSSWVQA